MTQLANGYNQNVHGVYKAQEIAAAGSEKLILYLYDYAIKACHRKNQDQASHALEQLIDSLDFEYHEVSTGLFKLYVYMIETIKKGQFEVALNILKDLRKTWNIAIENLMQEQQAN